MAKYMLLIFGDPAQWDAMTPGQGKAHDAAHAAFAAAAGTRIAGSEELELATMATTLGSDGAGGVLATDGPFAETKEQVGGFYLLEASRLDEAIKLASMLPEVQASHSGVEIRPVVARTAYWLGWHHHFGPASGSDPKISDPLGRYCMAVFTGGVYIGPYEAVRHIAGVSARELSMVRNRHIDLKKLNAAIATVVNAFAELDVVRAWGDGTAVAADGTQVETYIDNLLAETSIRYGGVGGIAYHYVSDTYVALFSRFIPCGGVGGGAPDRGPAGQQVRHPALHRARRHPGPVHAGVHPGHLVRFDLMPRIRNWQDLMQVAISISEGRLSSATLLRYLADPQLRARITAATNKVESYNGFAQWLSFGNNGVLADNDPAEQEKLIKLNTLLANLVIFHNALDIMDVVRSLVAEGWLITADQLGAMSPYLRAHISRFGAYATDELTRQPDAFNPVLKEVDFTAPALAA